jgi:hypothetical protein
MEAALLPDRPRSRHSRRLIAFPTFDVHSSVRYRSAAPLEWRKLEHCCHSRQRKLTTAPVRTGHSRRDRDRRPIGARRAVQRLPASRKPIENSVHSAEYIRSRIIWHSDSRCRAPGSNAIRDGRCDPAAGALQSAPRFTLTTMIVRPNVCILANSRSVRFIWQDLDAHRVRASK